MFLRRFLICVSFLAGLFSTVCHLRQMNPGFESVGLSCVVDVCMVSKRSELMDGGEMDGLIA